MGRESPFSCPRDNRKIRGDIDKIAKFSFGEFATVQFYSWDFHFGQTNKCNKLCNKNMFELCLTHGDDPT